ncbi:MAG TPA: hypothetical protein VE953_05150 [Terriglobales bacterium]|nr:hypothetical protein [Terriglobales bacterium]
MEARVHLVVALLGAVVLLPVLVAAAYDLVLERRGESLGLHLARWSRRYPFFAAALILLLGAMLAHFFTAFPTT